MTRSGQAWRVLDGVPTAWFDAPSLSGGAALAARVLELTQACAIDLRASGVRVRLDSGEHAPAVANAAADLGLAPDPSVLQSVALAVEASDPGVGSFWGPVLDYRTGADGVLLDPLRRDPPLRVEQATERRPLRQRLHLDVVRPEAAVAAVGLGDGGGPYGVRHADPDGNEVDLVPGGPLGEDPATADWQAVFAAMACYRVTSQDQQWDLAAGFPLMIDVRPGLVVLDSGKDQWEDGAHPPDLDVPRLAARLQAAARAVGAIADAGLPRFVQVFLDAADVDAVRAFWTTALGYVPDLRTGITDVHDPRRLSPVVVFQDLDGDDADERRRQRNRTRVELSVPADLVEARVATALAAGGRVLAESPGRRHLADPEGNELVVVGAGGP